LIYGSYISILKYKINLLIELELLLIKLLPKISKINNYLLFLFNSKYNMEIINKYILVYKKLLNNVLNQDIYGVYLSNNNHIILEKLKLQLL